VIHRPCQNDCVDTIIGNQAELSREESGHLSGRAPSLADWLRNGHVSLSPGSQRSAYPKPRQDSTTLTDKTLFVYFSPTSKTERNF